MKRRDLLRRAAELAGRDEPFVLATVVRREPPSSTQVGDGALITREGTFHGWLGGSCTRPAVVREALQALQDGVPRLIALRPDPVAETRAGVVAVPLTCHSGGSVDVYIEPILPAPRLLVYGTSPAAQALVRIAKVLGYAVEAVDPEADDATFPDADHVVTDPASSELRDRAGRDAARLSAVVATLGIRDEDALEEVLALSPSYVGLIASRKRFGEIRKLLRARGVTAEALGRISCPAGLDIGAVSPAEVALSVMAAVVERARRAAQASPEAARPPAAAELTDPVCGMTVDPKTAAHQATVSGRTYYFCCGGCRAKFVAAPDAFVASDAAAGQGT